jgi:uncharacterized protein (TIGR03437 family)
MSRRLAVLASVLLIVRTGVARQIVEICGTNPERRKEELHLHRQAELARRAARMQSAGGQSGTPRAAARDIGNIVVLEDADGVVARRNPFNLDQKTLTFTTAMPVAAAYQFQVSAGSYDEATALAGAAVRLADDDSHEVSIPFPFPFFGKTYQSVFINSDGNLTFTQGDDASSDRSLGRMVAGPPRISPLFRDLDPSKSSNGVTVSAGPTRLVVSWVQVPEYSDFGFGTRQTFQVRLYADGRIQFAYAGINTAGAIVGVAPGHFQGFSAVVSFLAGSSVEYSSTVAERFGGSDEIDIETAAQKFFETHDDAYDYIAFFNDENIQAGAGALSWEQTLRNSRSGYGDIPIDDAAEYGSPSRLQSVLNMGPLSQLPASPTGIISLRSESRYTPMKLLAHESGHLFLAYASVRDPVDPTALPMLGIQQAHWAFNFNAEASFMEGNRIQDNGTSASPRYIVTADVEQYAPLDQYLMGFRAASEVPPMFLVTGNAPGFSLTFPQVGITFNGGRRNIQIAELIQAEGRRTPDSTVAQRHFRMALVLIVKQGSTPPAAELAQLEGYRSQFETFYSQATGGRGHMDAALRHALSLSAAPAAGVVAGGSMTAGVSIQQPAVSALTVNLQSGSGAIAVPPFVMIPKGATSVNFAITGLNPGVDDLTATPADSNFETAYARVQVLPAAALLLSTVSGNKQVLGSNGTLAQPVVVRVSDQNNLPYPGVRLEAVPTTGGTVAPQVDTTDATGRAAFQWTPGLAGGAQLRVFAAGAPAQGIIFTALPPTSINQAGVVNSASFAPGISPGGLATILGTTLSGGTVSQAGLPWPTELGGVTVQVNNETAQLLYVSDTVINFVAPPDLAPGTASLTVLTGAGTSASLQVPVTAVAPGIFFDYTTNFGAILIAGTSHRTQQQPAARGQYISIYCTGLGAVKPSGAGLMATVSQPQVSIANVLSLVQFSGLVPGYIGGLYVVNVQVPGSVPSGAQPVVLTINGVASNSVKVAIQ